MYIHTQICICNVYIYVYYSWITLTTRGIPRSYSHIYRWTTLTTMRTSSGYILSNKCSNLDKDILLIKMFLNFETQLHFYTSFLLLLNGRIYYTLMIWKYFSTMILFNICLLWNMHKTNCIQLYSSITVSQHLVIGCTKNCSPDIGCRLTAAHLQLWKVNLSRVLSLKRVPGCFRKQVTEYIRRISSVSD